MTTSRTAILVFSFLALGLTVIAFDKPDGKKYAIFLREAIKIGSIDFSAGEYRLVVGATKVHLVEISSGEALELAGTIRPAEEKFERTALVTAEAEQGRRLKEIHLGGSKTKVTFP